MQLTSVCLLACVAASLLTTLDARSDSFLQVESASANQRKLAAEKPEDIYQDADAEARMNYFVENAGSTDVKDDARAAESPTAVRQIEDHKDNGDRLGIKGSNDIQRDVQMENDRVRAKQALADKAEAESQGLVTQQDEEDDEDLKG